MEPEISLRHSHVPANFPYPEPAQSSPCPHFPFPEDPSYHYPPIQFYFYIKVNTYNLYFVIPRDFNILAPEFGI